MPHPFFCFYHGDSSNEGCRTAGFSSESDLEDIVFRAIRSNIELIEGAMAEKRALMKAAEKEKDAKKRNLEAVRLQMERLKGDKLALYEKYADGGISKEEYVSRKQAYDQKIEAVKAELEESAVVVRVVEEELPEEIESSVREYSDQAELSNEMAKAFVEAVYVCSNDSVEIRWRYSDFFGGNEAVI